MEYLKKLAAISFMDNTIRKQSNFFKSVLFHKILGFISVVVFLWDCHLLVFVILQKMEEM